MSTGFLTDIALSALSTALFSVQPNANTTRHRAGFFMPGEWYVNGHNLRLWPIAYENGL
jgi:hypothetical protein